MYMCEDLCVFVYRYLFVCVKKSTDMFRAQI